MHTTQIGMQAEAAVIEYLQNAGYDVIGRNWKTKTCEIDIIAYRNGVIHFVEVKYRRTNRQGLGFEYISQGKLRRMRYAAQLWVCKNNWYGGYVLSAASVTGPKYDIEFIREL